MKIIDMVWEVAYDVCATIGALVVVLIGIVCALIVVDGVLSRTSDVGCRKQDTGYVVLVEELSIDSDEVDVEVDTGQPADTDSGVE